MDIYTQGIIDTKVRIVRALYFQKINNKMKCLKNKIVR